MLVEYPLYSWKRISTMLEFGKEHSRIISQRMGGGSHAFWILCDMLWCDLAYGAMDSRDYLHFEFNRKSRRERKRYLTKRKYFKMLRRFDFETFSRLMVKGNAYKQYASCIRRDWMIVDSNTDKCVIEEFVRKHGSVLAKPNTGEQGSGIFRAELEDVDKIVSILKKGVSYILEEIIVNAEEIRRLNPSSLNTFRVYTVTDKQGIGHIIAIMLRVGREGALVDNWGSGGVGYNFDLETGVCVGYGYDKMHNSYVYHPGSNKLMVGFKIPDYSALVKYVDRLTAVDPKTKMVGWDIALTEDGYELVEMNFPGGHDFLQAFNNPHLCDIEEYF